MFSWRNTMNTLGNTFTGTREKTGYSAVTFPLSFFNEWFSQKSISGIKPKHFCYKRTHNKRDNVRKTWHWGAFVQPLLQWKRNNYYIFWACGKPVWHIPLLYVQWKTPDNGQRNCPKHVDFYSKTKFEKLVHLVGFIIKILMDCRRCWCFDTATA